MIVCDTSGLLALLDESEPDHEAAWEALQAAGPPYVVSPFVLAELEPLISWRGGPGAAREFLADVSAGAYSFASFSRDDLEQACQARAAYPELNLGLADASLLALAKRYGEPRVLTLDRRRIRMLRTVGGGWFEIVPKDLADSD